VDRRNGLPGPHHIKIHPHTHGTPCATPLRTGRREDHPQPLGFGWQPPGAAISDPFAAGGRRLLVGALPLAGAVWGAGDRPARGAIGLADVRRLVPLCAPIRRPYVPCPWLSRSFSVGVFPRLNVGRMARMTGLERRGRALTCRFGALAAVAVDLEPGQVLLDRGRERRGHGSPLSYL